MKFTVSKCPHTALAVTNRVYVNPKDGAALDSDGKYHDGRLAVVGAHMYTYEYNNRVREGTIALNALQRRDCAALIGETVHVTVFIPIDLASG